MTILGPYESRSVYRGLHFDADAREWAEFLAEDNNPHERDGAARSAGIPPTVVAASTPQPAPSPQAKVVGRG